MLKTLIMFVLAAVALSAVSAQNTNASLLKPGDPPIASLITVSEPDANGLVTITGGVNSVFPTAQVAVRNLYTQETVYTQAGVTGSFSATLYGPGNTPFWISPAPTIPNEQRNRPGSLPGGPGTIVYGPFSQALSTTTAVTKIITDGELSDWQKNYAESSLLTGSASQVYALLNHDSLRVGFGGSSLPTEYTQINLVFSLDNSLYSLSFDPRQQQLANYERLDPNPRRYGPVAIDAVQGKGGVEVRIPLSNIDTPTSTVKAAIVEDIVYFNQASQEINHVTVKQPTPVVDEQDGIVRLDSQLGENVTRFTFSGQVARGAGHWFARGRMNSLTFKPGDTLVMEMDVTLDAPGLPAGLVGLQMFGQLGFQPVIGADGSQAAGGLRSNNGWSKVLTPSGLPIVNLTDDVALSESLVPAPQVIRRGSQLMFGIDFSVKLPENLPAGLYVPTFQGGGRVADGDRFFWNENSPLGTGKDTIVSPFNRLPLLVNVGGIQQGHLVWTLFQDSPSNGSRGILAQEDSGKYGLANLVRFNSPTYILPPSDGAPTYPLEPYILMQTPNSYYANSAPLIPFRFPGGRLSVKITKPDGSVDDLGTVSIIQSVLSTPVQDERTLFGAQTQVDVYRLTTLNRAFSSYAFNQYGQYTVNMTGAMEDVWGNQYNGGGTYSLLIAEPLDILPGVLSGAPFHVGDTLNAGMRLSPAAPADVSMTVRIYPLGGGQPMERVIKGKADRYGYFHADGVRFDAPGEYVIDYEARYTDGSKRLWAGSVRSAGVIADPKSTLIAHGGRGLDNYDAPPRPAWFSAGRYLSDATNIIPRLVYPFHSGDVAWMSDGQNGQLAPLVQAQDTGGAYANWLQSNAPDYRSWGDLTMAQSAVAGELPVAFFGNGANQAYTYISAVHPAVTARQYVQGGINGGLTLYWDSDDPFNQQIGAGVGGDRPDDFLFLFGGAVVRNEAAKVQETAAYASLAVVIDPNDPAGARVFPPYRGEAGGADGGPLFTLRGQPVNMFFHPTGVGPGQALAVGDTLAIAGQVAPPLASVVTVNITSPGGKVRSFEGTASPTGYFYNPAQDFAVDESGVWRVQVRVRHEGATSAGQIEPPPPTGGILGGADDTYLVYVLPQNDSVLGGSDVRADTPIPAAVPYNFNFRLPDDWKSLQVYHTVTIPGFILEEGPIRPNGTSFTYQYVPANLGKDFPNLETNGQGDGPSSSDVVTVTLYVSGTDKNGQTQRQTRVFTIMHDRLVTFDSEQGS
jgi:hypothetical protein